MKTRTRLLAAVLALVPLTALAHGIAVWAEVKDGKIHVEAHYSDGKPVANGKVTVSAGGKTVLTGKTDEKGDFDFAPPVRKALAVKVVAGGHHGATATVKEEDLEDVPLAAPAPDGARR